MGGDAALAAWLCCAAWTGGGAVGMRPGGGPAIMYTGTAWCCMSDEDELEWCVIGEVIGDWYTYSGCGGAK